MLLLHKAKLVLCVYVHVYIWLHIFFCKRIQMYATVEMSISQRKCVCAPVGFVLSDM